MNRQRPEDVRDPLHRLARRALAQHQRREAAERCRPSNIPAGDQTRILATAQRRASWRLVRMLLDREITKLPGAYKLPVILHCLEGRGVREVADMLRLDDALVRRRLARGRQLLRQRLARGGLVLSAGKLAQVLRRERRRTRCLADTLHRAALVHMVPDKPTARIGWLGCLIAWASRLWAR